MAKLTDKEIILKGVTLNFEHIFKPSTSKNYPDTEPKYNATFMLSKKNHGGQIAEINKIIDLIAKEQEWKKKADKLTFRDGDESEIDSLAGYYTVKASSKNRPQIVHRDLSPIIKDDGLIHNGNIVDAHIRFYFSTLWKGITAELVSIQYKQDGEQLGRPTVDVADIYEKEEINNLENEFGF